MGVVTTRHGAYEDIRTFDFRNLNLSTVLDYYPGFDSVTGRTKQIFAHGHGTEWRPAYHGLLPSAEAKLEPGTLVYIDKDGDIRPLRMAVCVSDDSSYNGGTGISTIQLPEGHAKRFKVGMDVFETQSDDTLLITVEDTSTPAVEYTVKAMPTYHEIGTITAIDLDDDILTVDGEITLGLVADSIIYCANTTDDSVPVIEGITPDFYGGALSIDDEGTVTRLDAPCNYLRHCIVIKELITYYGADELVLAKIRKELPVLDWQKLARLN
jgi:hypothetical protein